MSYLITVSSIRSLILNWGGGGVSFALHEEGQNEHGKNLHATRVLTGTKISTRAEILTESWALKIFSNTDLYVLCHFPALAKTPELYSLPKTKANS